MKSIRLFLFLFCCYSSATVFGQSPKAIEMNLLKSFKKIGYWDQRINDTTVDASDSLDVANDLFGSKLKEITARYPVTITQPFPLLKKEAVNIYTSSDSLFRIYAWDTGGTGTMREFENVIQIKAGQKTKSLLLKNSEEVNVPFYSNLYTFKTSEFTYYLGIFGVIESSRYAGTGIKVFSIENGKLNDTVKLLKTGSGLKNQISYEYDFGSIANIPFEKRPTITFNAVLKTINIPLVDAKGRVTKKVITYKFNGRYFTKIAS